MFHHKSAGQNHNLQVANKPFENVAKFSYLGTAVTDQNCIYEEFGSRLNSDIACCCLLSSSILSKKLKIKLYKTILSVLYGCETGSLTSKEEHRLRVFENRMFRRIFVHKGEEVAGGWRRLYNKGLPNLYTSVNVISVMKSRRMKWVRHIAFLG
jgi:hypothetical protein